MSPSCDPSSHYTDGAGVAPHNNMTTSEDALAAAATLLGPFLEKGRTESTTLVPVLDAGELVKKALWHIKAINAADIAGADANAPYDASLAGVVYALLDIITLLGIVPQLSPGVAFSQRPRPVLSVSIMQAPGACGDGGLLAEVIDGFLSILEQHGSGIQPLLSQRVLPDVITGLAELAFSPASNVEDRSKFANAFQKIISGIPTSRILPILTTLLQQLLPSWLKPIIAYELSVVPLRGQGIRHTIEFLSLSCLYKNSRMSPIASDVQSQIPIPVEAITQASHLLVLPPRGTSKVDWLRKLAPQLLDLLDGGAGQELTRAAGQIIAGGILSKKATGAPGSIGWELFVTPLFHKIYPKAFENADICEGQTNKVIVQEPDLRVALKRISAIALSYSHVGLLNRLIGPLLLPLWALLNFAKHKRSLDEEWTALPQTILTRYIAIACDAKRIDMIALNLFWDGDAAWFFGSGSHGGVEIRQRTGNTTDMNVQDNILSRIGEINSRTKLLTDLLVDANIADEMAGAIFLLVTKRWLAPAKNDPRSLTEECDMDPLGALRDAKLSETLATQLREKLATSPQQIIELMVQLVENFVNGYRLRVQKAFKPPNAPTRAMLGDIVKMQEETGASGAERDMVDEDLATYALSVLSTLISSPGFKPAAATMSSLHAALPSLAYLVQQQRNFEISPLIRNSAATILHLLNPTKPALASSTLPPQDTLNEHRATLRTVFSDLQSSEPPCRAWALGTVHKLICNPTASPVIDVPSLTHTLLSVSLADSESYVHTAAAPVILSLAIRAPRIVIRIVTEAFTDIEESSLRLTKGKGTMEERVLQEALDFRLRVGEVLSTIVLEEKIWSGSYSDAATRYESARYLVEACLALASRRGQRKQTSATRAEVTEAAERLQEEGEAAWGGPIPNVLEPEGRDATDRAEIDALSGILHEWENTGLEEDVRIRTSALSVLSMVLEHRLDMARQSMVDVSVQLVLTMLTMETSEAKAMLRRAAVLVLLGLLRGLDTRLEGRRGGAVDLSMAQQQEVESVARWVQDADVDALAREHADAVVEGLETLRVKRLFRMRDAGLRLGPELALADNLQGLHVTPGALGGGTTKKGIFVEEME